MLLWLKRAFFILGALYIFSSVAYLYGALPFTYTMYLLLATLLISLAIAYYVARQLHSSILYLTMPAKTDKTLKWILLVAFIIVTIMYLAGLPFPTEEQFMTAAGIFWTVIFGNFVAATRTPEEVVRFGGFPVRIAGGRPQTVVAHLKGARGQAIIYAQEYPYGRIHEFPVPDGQDSLALHLSPNKGYWIWAEDEEDNASWPIYVYVLRKGKVIPPPGCSPYIPSPPAEKHVTLTLGKATAIFTVRDEHGNPVDVTIRLEHVRTGEVMEVYAPGGDATFQVPLGRWHIYVVHNGIEYDMGREVRAKRPTSLRYFLFI